MVHATSLWSSAPTAAKPPASATSVHHNGSSNGDASSYALNGAVGRRGSRVLTFPSWFFPSKLSPQAVYLLASLLHPDPAKRFSCEDAYKSNWVTADPMQ
ncbi:Camk/camkl protein kinase [Globisporangium polare]